MSFAIRTPVKPKKGDMTENTTKLVSPPVTELIDLITTEQDETRAELMSQTFSVRKSIGELEALSQPVLNAKSPPKKLPSKGKLKLAFPQTQTQVKPQTQTQSQTQIETCNSPVKKDEPKLSKVPAKKSVTIESGSSTPPKYKNRVDEAKANVIKAKAHLNSNSAKNISTLIKNEVSAAVDRIYELLKESEGRIKGQTKEKGAQATLDTERHEDGKPKKPDKQKKEVQIQEDKIMQKLNEHTRALEENTKRINELKESLTLQSEILEKASYASVLAKNIEKPAKQKTLHSIIIASGDETDSSDQLMEQARSAINAKEGGIQVQKVRKARNQRIIMGFNTTEERNIVKERIEKSGKKLVVEEVRNRDPLLVLRNVINAHTDEELIGFLRSQNRALFCGLNKEEDRIEIKYRRKARNPHQANIVARVSPTIWNRALAAGTVSIDIQPIRVEDQSPLVQCSLCLGYGHARKHCTEATVKCSHCGGDHMKVDCPGWVIREAPECCNCVKAKLDNREHNAFSSDCPVRRKWEQMARSTVAYC
ncbi:hypothetical protein O0L34_g14909 [Tuta absoluta]|nr:hypothetical protein O0L34_g14909 [Tuta absoluta]